MNLEYFFVVNLRLLLHTHSRLEHAEFQLEVLHDVWS